MEQWRMNGFISPKKDQTGINTGDATAEPGDVFIGKTFYVDGIKKTGINPGGGVGSATITPADVILGKLAYGATGAVIGTNDLKRYDFGSTYHNYNQGGVTIAGLAFNPSFVYVYWSVADGDALNSAVAASFQNLDGSAGLGRTIGGNNTNIYSFSSIYFLQSGFRAFPYNNNVSGTAYWFACE